MGRSVAYDLLDTSRRNIQALVRDPAAADTNDIDRETYEVPFETPYGERWMWVAHRTPLLRDARIRWTLLTVLAVLTAVGRWGGDRADTRQSRSESNSPR